MGERVRENRGVGVGMREKSKTAISYYHECVKSVKEVEKLSIRMKDVTKVSPSLEGKKKWP